MRTVILSDIHGNLEALNAVLADAEPFDAAICLGDIVGYGAQPNECIAAVRALPQLICLAGNHDLGAVGRENPALFSSGAGRALTWTRHALLPACEQYLIGLESIGEAPNLALAHATPRDPVWEYLETSRQAAENFKRFEQEVCLVGHTHVPRTFEEQRDRRGRVGVYEVDDMSRLDLYDGIRRMVNPGSVGQPRDGDPRAAYALFDTDSGLFTSHRVRYQIERAQHLILAAGLPPSLASRLAYGM